MENKNGFYRVVTGRPGRPRRYATKEEIPKELLEKYEVVFEPGTPKEKEDLVPNIEIDEFMEGVPIEGEKPGEDGVPRPPKIRIKKRIIATAVPTTANTKIDQEFDRGVPIEGEKPEDVGVGRPIMATPLRIADEEKLVQAARDEGEEVEEDSEEGDTAAKTASQEDSLKNATQEKGRCKRHSSRRGKSQAEEAKASESASGAPEAPSEEEDGLDVETPSDCTPKDVELKSQIGDINYLLCRSNDELREIARESGVRHCEGMRRQDLIYNIMRVEYAKEGYRLMNGVLDIILVRGSRCGFLRRQDRNFTINDGDLYVSPAQITRFGLQKGDTVYGVARRRRTGEKSSPVIKVAAVNYMGPDSKLGRTPFEELTPEFAAKRYLLEYDPKDASTRIMDLISPIGKGQRGLIVAPPRTGKTILLRDIANAISHNNPQAELIMLLIDERPEEVTDMKRCIRGEVVSSTFDEPAERHIEVAEMVLEKAKRLVECRQDVIILLDSLTRLARAYNSSQKNSGKILSGGMDASAMQKPKRFFGAARSIEGGGSLTIVATALVETGSRMDDLVFEEFKGTGNMECVLDRRIGEKRIFPAIDVDRSGTRKEELLFDEKEYEKVLLLRRMLGTMQPLGKIERLIDYVKLTSSNAELLMMLKDR